MVFCFCWSKGFLFYFGRNRGVICSQSRGCSYMCARIWYSNTALDSRYWPNTDFAWIINGPLLPVLCFWYFAFLWLISFKYVSKNSYICRLWIIPGLLHHILWMSHFFSFCNFICTNNISLRRGASVGNFSSVKASDKSYPFSYSGAGERSLFSIHNRRFYVLL